MAIVCKSSNHSYNTSGTSHSVTLPTDIAVGDYIFLFLATEGNSGTITSPSGFTLIRDSSTGTADTDIRISSYYKKITDLSDVGTTKTFAVTTSTSSVLGYSIYSGIKSLSVAQSISGSRVTGATSTNPTASVTFSVGANQIAFALFGSEVALSAGGWDTISASVTQRINRDTGANAVNFLVTDRLTTMASTAVSARSLDSGTASKSYMADAIILNVVPNTDPTTPTNITIDTGTNAKDELSFVGISWTPSSDAEGDTLSYEVDFYDGTKWVNFAKNVGTTSALHFLPLINGGTSSAKYRVRSFDGDIYSSYAESGVFTVNNTYPFSNTSRTDVSVINSAYDTSGNGGRKLVRLSNGTLITVVKNGTTQYRLYKSTDNGNSWSLLGSDSVSSIQGVALATNGTYIYVLHTFNNANVQCGVWSEDGVKQPGVNQDSSQTAMGDCSLAINESGTELHACWSSKNSTYPNSFNLRYAKGTINGDGSVTWGSVTQRTTENTTGSDFTNPTIIVKGDGNPVIATQYSYTTKKAIISFYFNGSTWTQKDIHDGGSTYTQSSPSAIFVPQSVNGLANGRIWVAWHGADGTDTTANNIRVSCSDDGGATWVTMIKLTVGNVHSRQFPTLTANKGNEVFVLYRDNENATVSMRKWIGSTNNWTSQEFASGNGVDPSTLYDTSLDFSKPLFIREGNSSGVFFSGTWNIPPTVDGSKLPKSMSLDGSTGYLDVGNRIIPATGDFTIEFNLKTTALSQAGFLFQLTPVGTHNLGGVMESDGRIRMYFGATNIITTDRFDDNVLHNIAFIRSGNNYSIIVDGVTKASGTATGVDLSPATLLTLGRNTSNNYYFKGMIGLPRFWDTARTNQQLIDNKNTILTGNETNLIDFLTIDPVTGKYVMKNNLYSVTSYGNILTAKSFSPLADFTLPYPSSSQKKENLETLRIKANEFRQANGLPAYTWTTPVLTPKVTPILATHMNEVQIAINEVYNQVGEVISDINVKNTIQETVVSKSSRFPIKGMGDRYSHIIRALKNQ